MKIIKSIASVGVFTILSRVAGFVREAVMAALIGVGPVVDALSIAIKLPSTFRRLLAEGAFNAVFVPMFSSIVSADGPEKARTWAVEILSFLTAVLVVLVLLFEFFAEPLMQIIMPGFEEERLQLVVYFSRITFPFILFISLTALYSGILNSIDRFVAAASSPMAGNIFIVLFIWLFNKHMETAAHTFCWGVLFSGLVQLLWVWGPSRHYGFGLIFRFPKLSLNIRQFLSRMIPGAIGSGVTHINAFLGMMIASFLPKGGPSILNFADRLGQLPLSVIGTAVSTALLPLVSRQIRANDTEGAMQSQNRALEFTLILAIPSTIGLICLAEPLVAVAYERRAFTPEMTYETARTLIAFACGLPAFILIKIFTTSFFARKDTRTPMIIASISMVIDVILAFALMKPFQHVGIAMALSIASWCTVLMLIIVLKKRGYFKLDDAFKAFAPRLGAACFYTFVVTAFLYKGIVSYLYGSGVTRIVATVLFFCACVVIYMFFIHFTKTTSLKKLMSLSTE